MFYSKPVFRRGGPERGPGKSLEETKNKEIPKAVKDLAKGFVEYKIGYEDETISLENWLLMPKPTGGGFKKVPGDEFIGTITQYTDENGATMKPNEFNKLVGDISGFLNNNKAQIIKGINAKNKRNQQESRATGKERKSLDTPNRVTRFDSQKQVDVVKGLEDELHKKMTARLISDYITGPNVVTGPNVDDRTPQKLRERASKFQKTANEFLKKRGFYLSIVVKGTDIVTDFYPINKKTLPKKTKYTPTFSRKFEEHIKKKLVKVVDQTPKNKPDNV